MIVAVEGNVGSGKSTALAALAALLEGLDDAPLLAPEPVDDPAWAELMRLAYEDPGRWALAFSAKVLLGHGPSAAAAARPGARVVCERSPASTRLVFNELLRDDGSMTAADLALYNQLDAELGWEPDRVIYVRASAEACMARVRGRGRDGEGGVDLVFLRRLERAYDSYVASLPPGRVTVVDGDMPGPDVAAAVAARVLELLA